MKAIKSFVVATVLFCRLVTAGPGSLDPSFAPKLDGNIADIAIQPDGKVLICGAFGHVNDVIRMGIARLFPDGSLDTNFFSTARVSSTTLALALQTDGKLLVGGDFSSIAGTPRAHLARLNSDGTLDSTFPFSAGVNSTVTTIVIQPDGKFLVGGAFTALQNNAPQRGIVRFNSDGTLDSDFNTSTAIAGTVSTIAVQADGEILIGGTFTQAFGVTRNHIARLLSNGLIDLDYQDNMAGANGFVRSVALQPDGKALVGGEFTLFNNFSRQRIVRLNLDGSLDTTFVTASAASGPVYSIVPQPDTNVVIGGLFTSYRFTIRKDLARLLPDSKLDTNYLAKVGEGAGSGAVQKIALQSDGRMLVGGSFLTFSQSESRSYLVRVFGDLYPPEITRQPVRRSVPPGTNVTFSVTVNNPQPVSYQWRKDGVDILNATTNTFQITNVQLADAGYYSVAISNSIGVTLSTNVFLYVGDRPAIAQDLAATNVNLGERLELTVVATGPDLRYLWYHDGGQIVPPQTNATLVISNVAPADAGNYQVLILNPVGSIASTQAYVHVLSAPIAIAPTRVIETEAGDSFLLSANIYADPNASYQWLKNGVAIPNQTNGALSLPRTTTEDSGDYDVIAVNSLGALTNRTAILILTNVPPTLIIEPQGGVYAVGDRVVINMWALGTEPLTWNWFKNGTPLPSVKFHLIEIEHATEEDSGDYYAIVSNPAGADTSITVHVDVGIPPRFLTQPLGVTGALGGNVKLTAAVSGAEPIALEWRVNDNAIPGATNTTLVFTNLLPKNIGYYTLVASNRYGVTNSAVVQVNVNGYRFDEWNGLIGYWPLSGNANDVAGTNNGSVFSATPATDRFGDANSAFAFDGSTSYLEIPNAPELNPGINNFTLTLWERADAPQLQTYLAAKYETGNSGSYGLGTEEHGYAYAFVWGNTEAFYVEDRSTITLCDGRWHQVSMVVRDNYISIYLDGALYHSDGPAFGSLSNSLPLLIGRSASGQNFAGVIDEVRFYNRALSPTEITAQFQRDVRLETIEGPADVTAALGQTVTFSVSVPTNSQADFYWYKNGDLIAGPTSNSITITNITTRDIGAYFALASSSLGSISSRVARLSVPEHTFIEWAGLLAGYHFDGDGKDVSDNHLDAVMTNVVATTDRFGSPGGALLFDGASSDLFQSNAVINLGQSEYTISVWFRTDDVLVQNQVIFDSFPHQGIYLVYNHVFQPGKIAFVIGNGSSWITPFDAGGRADYGAGEWHHVALIKHDQIYRLYIDGEEDVADSVFEAPAFTKTVAYRFGTNLGAEWLKGALDEARLFTYALSALDMRELYRVEAPAARSTITMAVRRDANGVSLSFDAEANVSYSVLQSGDLTTGVWDRVASFYGSPAARRIDYLPFTSPNDAQVYFKVVSPSQP